jgi:hypothetical protein
VTVKRVEAALLLTFVGVLALCGQEASLVVSGIHDADAVVVGTLYRDFSFPWFDGWNERGHIVVEQVLKGTVKVGSNLSFAWERDFWQGWCLTRRDWRPAIGKRGIWLITRDGDRYRALDLFSGFGFYDMTELQKILAGLNAEN